MRLLPAKKKRLWLYNVADVAVKIPQHLAIIMDGNGRWAQARGLPRLAGHKAGVDAVRRTLESCKSIGIKVVTLFAFSTENWQRPLDEVTGLMGLLRFYLKSELARLHKEGVQFRVIGNKADLDSDIQAMITNAEELTANNDKFTLCIALNYGARQELVLATQKLAEQVAAGSLQASEITSEHISQATFTSGLPDPDLIIRTSGEQRLSNFLLWQAAYAEFYFAQVHWPDFDEQELQKALAAYGNRQRRFGKLPDMVGEAQ